MRRFLTVGIRRGSLVATLGILTVFLLVACQQATPTPTPVPGAGGLTYQKPDDIQITGINSYFKKQEITSVWVDVNLARTDNKVVTYTVNILADDEPEVYQIVPVSVAKDAKVSTGKASIMTTKTEVFPKKIQVIVKPA